MNNDQFQNGGQNPGQSFPPSNQNLENGFLSAQENSQNIPQNFNNFSQNPYQNSQNIPVVNPQQVSSDFSTSPQNPANNFSQNSANGANYYQNAENFSQSQSATAIFPQNQIPSANYQNYDPNFGAPQQINQAQIPPRNYIENTQPTPQVWNGSTLPQVQHPNSTQQNQYIPPSENPYTIEYLQKIAPKEQKPFWTKGKIFAIIFCAVGLIGSLFLIMAMSENNYSSHQKILKSYYQIQKTRELIENYEGNNGKNQKLKDRQVIALAVGAKATLKTEEIAMEELMKNAGIKKPKSSDLKKDRIYSKVAEEFEQVEKKLEDAFLNVRLDTVFPREVGFKIYEIKASLESTIKSSSSKKIREPLEKTLASIKQSLDSFKKHLEQ